MIPKFRAWDREKDRMIYPSTTGVCFEMNDDGISVLDIDVDYPNDYGFPKIASILMQSTGLRDKNSVEIFEGDIVLVSVRNGFDYLDNKVCIVKNSIDYSGLVCATVDEDLEYQIFNTELFEEYTYEVIGNIYENSELLEVE
ncbi:TPA: DNA-packaging protein [Enterococcus faecium]|uniref:YopX family protein n=1 Tax=Enterococcus faecium TaxID=1352 RepID=UPI00126146E0|nr:YopX family protein [Enterococcus faecium]KAB7550559.1 DNA-packaging protein [Enterococcus faecium]HAP6259250.1 DNA-packaging protein [Enterococcus faecium]HAP6267713.1 DNA-packaging protein [Enterococcus faecium]HAP6270679.1 DNA-packaging protein [Enterococcus faecium]HAP6273686.1 DNA-packaging protein [Enterococcus faecium]